jgi:putative transposase
MIPLEPEYYYHIYNHAVSKNNLFYNDENYCFFLKKYHLHISPVADTFSYCLMPNHFHLFVQIKSKDEIENFRLLSKLKKQKSMTNEYFVSKQFSNLFSSYTQALNKQQYRMGTLFMKPFKRKLITTDDYVKRLIYYIHYNPVHHGITNDLFSWKYSSYESFFSKKETRIKKQRVIDWFGSLENFKLYHQGDIDNQLSIDLE